jgi:intergrase/recombinase
MNRLGQIRYARTRHYSHIDKVSRKPQFTYHKLENLEALKTLLSKQGIQLNTNNTSSGQTGQVNNIDLKLGNSSLKTGIEGAGSSARIEHHPPKKGCKDQFEDMAEYRDFLLSKFSRSYALQCFNNGIKYYNFLEDPHGISALPTSIKGNILKAMVNLAKYKGIYEEYKTKLKNHDIKWINNDDSFSSFLRIVNNNHSNLGEWYRTVQNILRDNERLWLRFNLLTGLRKQESIDSFNLIISNSQSDNLSEYYNDELGILEHFKYGDIFLRQTKKVFISIVTKDLISQISNSKPTSYQAIRKRITRAKHNLRVRELRSYFATFLRKNGILSEFIDLLQGRIPKSVFAKHYLKLDSIKELVHKVNAITTTLENNLTAA